MAKKSTFLIFLLTLLSGFSVSVQTSAQQPLRTVLIEEFTGEWCGWCPIGFMELEYLAERFGDTLIIVAVHTNDPFEPPSASGMIGAWFSAAPSALVNRTFDTLLQAQTFYPELWEEVISRQINTPSPCNTGLTYTYNEQTRELTAKVTAAFTADYTGDARLSLYIVEDSVAGHMQSNYLSGNSSFINTPYYSMPQYIPDFPHQHVLREMVGDSYGIDGIIPDTVYQGQNFEYTFNYVIPDDYNTDNLHLIGVVQQYKGLKRHRKILNSVHYKFDPTISATTSVELLHMPSVWPNPARNTIHIKTNDSEMIKMVSLYSLSGKCLKSQSCGDAHAAFSLNEISSQTCILVIRTDSNVYYRKVIVLN